MNAVKAYGGGDECEAVHDGLWAAID